jgi:hypothetical protein
MRLNELEKECSNMRQEIEKLGNKGKTSTGWSGVGKKIGFKLKSNQMCSAQEGSVNEQQRGFSAKLEKLQAKVTKHKKQLSLEMLQG